MNVAVTLIVLIGIFIAGISGIAMLQVNEHPPADTYGNNLPANSSIVQEKMINQSGTAIETGGFFGIIIALIFVFGTMFAMIAIIYRSKNSSSSRR